MCFVYTNSTMNIDTKVLRSYFIEKPVDLVYLFGSQASGMAKPYSDIDIGVVFSSDVLDEEKFSLRTSFIAEISKLLKMESIDVVDLLGVSPFMRFEAIKHHKEVFVRNNATRLVFESNTLSEYFDRKYYLERHIRLGLQSLKGEYGVKA